MRYDASVRYLHHITLTTGHCACTAREEVADEVVGNLAQWLSRALAVAKPVPLAAPSDYQAQAISHGGGLVVTVYARPEQPLVTFGCTASASPELWHILVKNFGCADGLQEPPAPWCAATVHPSLSAHPEAASWLGDFERSLAWVWIERP